MSGSWWSLLGAMSIAAGLAGRAPALVGVQRARARVVGPGDRTVVRVPAWAATVGAVLGARLLVAAPGLLAVIGLAATVVVLAVRRGRPGSDREADLTAALEALAASLAVGASVRQAVAVAGARPSPVGRALAQVAAAADAGAALGPALDAWAATAHDPAVALLVDALAVARATGADPAAAVRTAGDAHRRRCRLRREVRALAAQAQASALVLVACPLAFLLVVAGADPSVRGVLVHRPLGWACLLAGIALDALGGAWMVALVRRVG